jgi:hypothetical protein
MNPFEIRTRLIELATEQLNRQYEINLEFARRSFDELVKANKAVEASWKEYMPKVPGFDEVVKEAEKLYGFVRTTK